MPPLSHVNLDSIKSVKMSKEIKKDFLDNMQTERIGFNRSSIEYS